MITPQLLATVAVAAAVLGFIAFRRSLARPSTDRVFTAFALAVVALGSAVGYLLAVTP